MFRPLIMNFYHRAEVGATRQIDRPGVGKQAKVRPDWPQAGIRPFGVKRTCATREPVLQRLRIKEHT